MMKNKRGVERVTSLSLSCKICLDKFIFRSDPLDMKTVERKGKNQQNTQHLKNEKSFLETQ